MPHKPQDQLQKELAEAGKLIKIGDYYKHFKNPDHLYHVEFLGFLESNDEVCVGYRGLYGHKFLFIRPLNIFLEKVKVRGKAMARFKKVLVK